MSQGADQQSKGRVLRGRASKEALRTCLPASGARTGWDLAWPGMAGMLGLGELRFHRGLLAGHTEFAEESEGGR